MQLPIAACEPVAVSMRLAMGLLLCTGCGTKLPVAPVSGTITFEGKPLVGASITTQPIGADLTNPGSGSFAQTDDQGRFELELVKPAVKGAIIGAHRVMISPESGDKTANQPQRSAAGDYDYWTDDPHAQRAANYNKWPTHFTDGSLRLQVPPEGAADVRLDLKRQPPPGDGAP